MKPEEKALELVNKYYNLKKRPLFTFWKDISYAKRCSLIAVDELISSTLDGSIVDDNLSDNYTYQYWKQVKQEINQL